jgi:hypothetical protein
MDAARLQAWWSHRQGLDGSLEGASPAEVLERSGWARSVGGVGPYLTLFARAGTSRADADAAVARLAIHELPAARGCTYVVPKSDFATALRAGQAFADSPMKVASKLGVTDKEIAALCKAVVGALAKGPLNPEGIRNATGTASRSLGDEGKKKGVSTTLPLALGLLQARGEIRRVPANGRLDQQRYDYALWQPGPFASEKNKPGDPFTELARRFFKWVGPATLAEYQWFSGLGVSASKEATSPLELAPMEAGSDRFLLPDDVDAFRKFKPPSKSQYALVSSLDAISATRRDVKTLLDPDDYARKLRLEKTVAPASSISDLPNHAILDRGRLIGLWEFDVETQSIVWATFGVKDKVLDAVVKKTEAFVRDDLGDARSFSLDSPKSRTPKIDALRKMR